MTTALHPGLVPERIQEVGGKAAVLEALREKDESLPIPEFEIVTKDTYRDGHPAFNNDNRIVRASSPLDLEGGFGIFPTHHFAGTGQYHTMNLIDYKPDPFIDSFMRRKGHPPESHQLAAVVQNQTTPDYFVVVSRHPVRHDRYIITVNDVASGEEAINLNSELGKINDMLKLVFGNDFYRRENRGLEFMVNEDGAVSRLTGKPITRQSQLTEMSSAVLPIYRAVESLEVLDAGYVASMEFGWSPDKVWLYQSSPFMKKHDVTDTEIPNDYIAVGSSLLSGPTPPEGITTQMRHFDSPRMAATPNRSSYFKDQAARDLADFDRGNLDLFAQIMGGDYKQMSDLGTRFASTYLSTVHFETNGNFGLHINPWKRQEADVFLEVDAPRLIVATTTDDMPLAHGFARVLFEAPNVAIGETKLRIDTPTEVHYLSNGLQAGVKELT